MLKIKYHFYFLALALTIPLATSEPQNCSVFEHRRTRYEKIPTSAEIRCKNVPPSLLIDSYYFVEKPYPQDLNITDSTIPTISNYSSLLNMRHIRKLTLNNLHIRHLQPGAFRNMQNLEELDLGDNELSEIPDGAFTGLSNLRRLYLPGNNISAEPQNAFKDLVNLEFVDISENPLDKLASESFVSKVEVRTK